jgi:hypothetical protein
MTRRRSRRKSRRSNAFGTSLSTHSKTNIATASAIAIIILLRTGYWSVKDKQSFIKALNTELSESLQNLLFSLSLESLFDLIEQLMGYPNNSIDRNLIIVIYLALTGLRTHLPALGA